MNCQYRLEILESTHSEALGELRRIAYKAQFGERVDDAKLSWNPNDLLFLNLGLFNGEQLAACLRISVIESDREFHRVTLQPARPGTRYPLIVLSRGATRPEFASQGLHSHLRLHALKLAQAAGPWDVLGAMEADSPRIKQLKELGYTFEACPNEWDGFLKSSQTVMLGSLDRTKLNAAIRDLEDRFTRSGTSSKKDLRVEIAFDFERAVHRLRTHAHRVSHERLDFQIDNQAMWDEVRPLLEQAPRYDRSPAFGGWSLQAHPDDPNPIHSGWPLGFIPYNGPDNHGPSWTPRNSTEKSLLDVQGFSKPTHLCTPLFSNLLKKLEAAGFTPRRARIIRLPGNTTIKWHQDGSPRIYQMRIHIPLKTNEHCAFESEFGRVHMKADGGLYFVHINRPHRAINEGPEERYHFVVHAWDTKGVTQHHRYDPTLYDFETHHEEDVDMKRQLDLPPPPSSTEIKK